MPSHRVLPDVRRVLVFLLVALCLAPGAVAQLPLPGGGPVAATLNLAVEDPGRQMVPGGNETISILVNYNVAAGAQPQPAPTQERPENTSATRITLTAKELPAWVVNATFIPEVLEAPLDQTAAAGTRVTMRANVSLVISPDAPALEKANIVVVGTAAPNGNIAGATAESQPTAIKATTVGKLNVSAEPAQFISGGRWAVIPYTVTNQGNSDVVAKLNVTLKPENAQVEFPTTLELKRNESKVVEVRVRTPWNAAEIGELELEAVPLVDGEEGQAATTAVEVTGRSAVPGAGVPLVLLAVALLAWRRR